MSTTHNATLEAALAYAARGWRVIPCHGVQNGRCSCHKGRNCRSKGKHPRLTAWEKAATTDEEVITGWFERWPLSNVGLVWGPDSGIIDIEFDDEVGRQNAEKLLGECFTPSYRSRRSVHRLFKWQPGLPEEAVGHVAGLEVRTGTDGGAQSIAPPSTHESGARYEWLPGLSPEDVEPQPIPAAMLDVIFGRNLPAGATNSDDPLAMNLLPGESRGSVRSKLYEQPEIVETVDGRDNVIHAEACAMWRERFLAYGPSVFTDADHQSMVYQRLWALNRAKCKPPLEDDDVQEKCEGGRKFIANQIRKEKDETPSYTALGLEWRDGEWWPGQWRVVGLRSEPPKYKLFVPFCEAPILLDVEQYDNAQEVHLAVQRATGHVCLDDRPGFWTSIWRGAQGNKKEGIPPRRALRAKLLDNAPWEEAKPESKRTAVVAQYVLEAIGRPLLIDGEKRREPDLNGRPSRMPDGSVVFKFTKIWEGMARSEDKVKRTELSHLLDEIDADEFRFAPRGESLRFQKLTPLAIKHLQQLAMGIVQPQKPGANIT